MLTSVSQTNVTDVQAQELCREFIKLIRKSYKRPFGMRGFRFKMLKGNYNFRACWRKRSLWSFDENPKQAMAKFMLEISRKVFLEHYYPQEEFKKIKDQLHERVIMKYSIRELPEEI